MTRDYAYKMWKTYFSQIRSTDDSRFLVNPGIQFTNDCKSGLYDSYSNKEYEVALSDVENESIFFHKRKLASVSSLFFRALQHTHFTNEEFSQILRIFANATSRTPFPKD